jgi:uncharacterized membrane protein YkoI
MRGITGFVGASIVLGLALQAAVAQSKAEKVPPDKLPAKVMAAVQALFPGAEFTGITKEIEDGKVVYDIEMKHKGRKCEMDVQEDGTVVDVEREVDAKDVPAAVKAGVRAKYPGSTITEVMVVNKMKDGKETPDHYEVLITTADQKKLELEVSLDGKTVNGGAAEGDKK